MKRLRATIISTVLLGCTVGTLANDDSSGAGTVAETIDVGAYVYVRLAEDDRWLAASPVSVTQGDEVRYSGGALMKDFYSPKLDRTFEDIVFVTNLEIATRNGLEPQQADPHQGMNPSDLQAALKSIEVSSPMPGEIEPLDGGTTIAAILASQESKSGDPVAFRARVMKVNLGILGRNWITLQDGTGAAPDDRVVATSDEIVAPGDLVVVRGTVRENVDLGSGYIYKVILENASFSK